MDNIVLKIQGIPLRNKTIEGKFYELKDNQTVEQKEKNVEFRYVNFSLRDLK